MHYFTCVLLKKFQSGFMLDTAAMGFFFSEHFDLPLSLQFLQRSIIMSHTIEF